MPKRDLNIRKLLSRILMQINESWLAIIRIQVSNVNNYLQIISSYAKSPLFVKYGLYIKGSPLLKESL